MMYPESKLGFGHGFAAPAAVTLTRSVLLDALHAWRRHTGPIAAHLRAIREVQEQVSSATAMDIPLHLFPAHAEAIAVVAGLAEDEILGQCRGTTRGERRRNADAFQRKQLRRLSSLRKHVVRLTFTMSNGAPFSLGAIEDDMEAISAYAVLDVETSGFSPTYGAEICEIAIVLVDTYGEITDQWTSLIKPRGGVGRSDIHGITAEMVANAPRIEEVYDEVWARLAGRVIVAHNSEFDLRFLRVMDGAGGNRDQWLASVLCTRQLARDYLPGSSQKLSACCEAAGIWIEQAHAALGDARATAQLLRYFIQKAGTPPPWAEKLSQATNTPAWLPCGLPQGQALPRSAPV